MRVTLLGTAGWMPTGSRETTCFASRADDALFIFDAGTGMRRLGDVEHAHLLEGVSDIHLFLTHYHLDHICGLAYLPGVLPGRRMTIHAPSGEPHGRSTPGGPVRLTRRPYNPHDWAELTHLRVEPIGPQTIMAGRTVSVRAAKALRRERRLSRRRRLRRRHGHGGRPRHSHFAAGVGCSSTKPGTAPPTWPTSAPADASRVHIAQRGREVGQARERCRRSVAGAHPPRSAAHENAYAELVAAARARSARRSFLPTAPSSRPSDHECLPAAGTTQARHEPLPQQALPRGVRRHRRLRHRPAGARRVPVHRTGTARRVPRAGPGAAGPSPTPPSPYPQTPGSRPRAWRCARRTGSSRAPRSTPRRSSSLFGPQDDPYTFSARHRRPRAHLDGHPELPVHLAGARELATSRDSEDHRGAVRLPDRPRALRRSRRPLAAGADALAIGRAEPRPDRCP